MTDLEQSVLVKLLALEITADEPDLLLSPPPGSPSQGQGRAEDGQAPPAAR